MFGLQNFGRLGASGRVAALPSLIAQLFTPGTAGFCGGMSVTEAFDAGMMFQDAAGTTPAALNAPVGLILGQDQGTGLGLELVTNGTNLTTTTGWTPSPNSSLSAVDGALRVTNIGDGQTYGYQWPTTVTGKMYRISVDVGAETITGLIRIVVDTYYGGSTLLTLDAAAGSTTLSGYFVATTTTTCLILATWTTALTGEYVDFANISVREVLSVPAYQTTTTKRPTLKDDGSGHLYLEFDGTDDCFVTPSIDLTGTDKVTVFWGGYTASDSSAMLAEFSQNFSVSSNSFYFLSGVDIVTGYNFNTKMPGGFAAGCATTFTVAAPNSAVVSIASDIAGSSNAIRVNGVAGTPNSASLGSGNFGDYLLFIGARDQSSFVFAGRMYTLPIIVGRTVEPALILEVEAAINASMGGIY